jgi:hypothetical protein
MLYPSSAAGWSQDGTPLQTIEHGMISGGIYVGGGHGRVFTTTYTQNFIVPNGTVKWARLYASAKDIPWINVTFNGHPLGNYTNLTSNPKVYANYKEDKSMYWAYYDNVADHIVNGNNTATAYLGSIGGASPKSWGIMLIAAYEDGDAPEFIEYWVNEGNPLLHGDQAPFVEPRNITNTSFDHVGTRTINATLWTGYIWGSEYEEPYDTLFFNSELIAVNASNGGGIDDLGNVWRAACFDLEKWDINNLEENNVVQYDRGGDDLLSPVLAVLVLKHRTISQANQTVHLGASIRPAIAIEVTPSSINFGELSPGETSSGKNLNVVNRGGCSINVSAEVTDDSENLFVDGMLLNDKLWSLYSAVIPTYGTDAPDVKLHVPDNYAGVGSKEGTLMFWAKKA